MFADYHVHSAYSDDSEYQMEQIVLDAIAMGIQELCFTEHVDYGIKRDYDDSRGILYRTGGIGEPEKIPLANVNYPEYTQEVFSLKEKYKDQISLKLGMEFGMQRHTISQYEKLYRSYPFDFIILSIHQVEDKEFWTGDFQRGLTQQEFYSKYYYEMLSLVENYHNYSVLGHMDLIARYDEKGDFPFEEVRPIIEKILQTVIADGKGIEVNTSCHRYGLAFTPSREILQLYHKLGGKILTIGSDSHKREHLGTYMPETLKELKTIGFQSICTYERMCPVFHKI